jgi:hypothetical protein
MKIIVNNSFILQHYSLFLMSLQEEENPIIMATTPTTTIIIITIIIIRMMMGTPTIGAATGKAVVVAVRTVGRRSFVGPHFPSSLLSSTDSIGVC